MTEPAERGRLVRQWVKKADNDLKNAEHTLTLGDDCPFDTVCFHAQQCAEKYLKALLIWLSVELPRTHDLRMLMQLVPEAAGFRVELRELLSLNRYSIEARYPGDWDPIYRSDAERAVAAARQVRQAVRATLSPEVLG